MSTFLFVFASFLTVTSLFAQGPLFDDIAQVSDTPAQDRDSIIREVIRLNENQEYDAALNSLKSWVHQDRRRDFKAQYWLAKQYILMAEGERFTTEEWRAQRPNLGVHLRELEKKLGTGSVPDDGNDYQQGVRDLKSRFSRLSGYDPSWGETLARLSRVPTARHGQCGNTNFNRGDCYECTGKTLGQAIGNSAFFFQHPGSLLNQPPYYASDFAHKWQEELHGPALGLSRTFYSTSNYQAGHNAALEAPIGSVIVWDKCGGSRAGHIAIKTGSTEACSSFCYHLSRSCASTAAGGTPRIIGVFTPTARP